MLGSLYGDLPDAKDSAATKPAGNGSKPDPAVSSGWGASNQRLLPAKRSAPAMPPSVLRAGGSCPVFVVKLSFRVAIVPSCDVEVHVRRPASLVIHVPMASRAPPGS